MRCSERLSLSDIGVNRPLLARATFYWRSVKLIIKVCIGRKLRGSVARPASDMYAQSDKTRQRQEATSFRALPAFQTKHSVFSQLNYLYCFYNGCLALIYP
ncbi:hypothetical protein L596_001005 [Steinernema carpocapsae]|uniref:Uncharacterized protein n=1 Tax=Steinernema carpocapsae TaxID=34508 RepID=A0A4U8UK14_STECR|nr:hypothetical protein L596_001005 [Steinernema carpocapsae]